LKVIAVDISGRHKLDDGRYCLVCAAVSAMLNPFDVEKLEEIKLVTMGSDDLSIETIAIIFKKACSRMKGIIVSEPGDFYSYPVWRVEAILGRKFKYAESVGERRAIEIAHHASLAAHRMLNGK
jgi:hypothetical protein